MDLSRLQAEIGYIFKSPELLAQALTHSSFANESGCSADNERLEFLGDSVLGFIVSEHLYGRFPERTEAGLSRLKSVLVSAGVLGRAAGALGLGGCMFLGKGEALTGGRRRESILADAFEAVAAAVFIDGGIESAREFVLRNLGPEVEKLEGDVHKSRYKGLLQEYAQSEFGVIPDYRVLEERGGAENERFTVRVSAGGRILGEGRGKNKKEAEAGAAKEALDNIGTAHKAEKA